MNRINPHQLVYELKPKHCEVCGEDQWCFFISQQEFDSWACPCTKVGVEKITEPISDNI